MKKFSAILALSFFLAPPVFGADWIIIAESNSIIWEGRSGSLHETKNNSNDVISAASGRTTDKASRNIRFEQWYVRVKDCYRGVGKIVTADIDGNFLYDTDFVIDGGNVASSIAEMLCYSYLKNSQKSFKR